MTDLLDLLDSDYVGRHRDPWGRRHISIKSWVVGSYVGRHRADGHDKEPTS